MLPHPGPRATHLRVLGWDVSFLYTIVMLAVGGRSNLQHDLAHPLGWGGGREVSDAQQDTSSYRGHDYRIIRQRPPPLSQSPQVPSGVTECVQMPQAMG